MLIDRLLVATTNPGKLREIRTVLVGLPPRLLSLSDVPATDAPDESGATFAENARLKAIYYARAAGVATVAEDSGLEVDALGGRPGVASARYGGARSSYPEKFARLYAELDRAAAPESAARFVCAVALVDQDRVVFEATGTLEGRIAPSPRGTDGFGYDPIFFYPPFGCTLGEAGDRKALVSHRTKAFSALRTFLESTHR